MSVIERVSVHPGLSFAPAPDWAEARGFRRPAQMPPDLIEHGLCFWRVDNYADWLGPEPVQFYRVVQEVVGSVGVQRASTFDASFEPSFERLIVHHVRVLRGGTSREVATPERIEILRREQDLERARYDGRLTAHLIIPDLRVGDIVDACYSVVGSNPALGHHYDASQPFQWSTPVAYCRFRLYVPASRKLAFRYWGARPAYRETSLNRGNLLRSWVAEGFAPFRYETQTPPWWVGHSQILVTDRMSWSDVADVIRPGFAGDRGLPADLEGQASRIRAEHSDPKARVAAALRLVQRDVRYLTISIGEGGYVPRQLGEIWATRFGDCKDVSRLLTALLQRLGVDACPALVNSVMGPDLKDGPPHARAFDHCIVRARLGGQVFWLDATRSVQGGRLDRMSQPRFGWALPLQSGATLEWMGEDPAEMLFEQHDRISFGPFPTSPAEFQAQIVFRGWRADDFRQRLENEGAGGLTKAYREYYEGHFGRVEVIKPLAVDDRAADNEVRTTETYRLLEPWRRTDDGGQVYFSTLEEALRTNLVAPSALDRRAPVDLGWPRKARHTTVLELPAAWSSKTWDDRWEVGGVRINCSTKLSNGARRMEVSSEIEIRERLLPRDLAQAFSDVADKARRSSGVTLSHRLNGGAFARSSGGGGVGRFFARNSLRVIWLVLIALYLLSQVMHFH